MHFFLMSQGSFNPKIRFLGQKVCSITRGHTNTQTGTLSGFKDFSFSLPSRIGPKYITCEVITWEGECVQYTERPLTFYHLVDQGGSVH